MYEIEKKARLTEQEFAAVKKHLDNNGKFTGVQDMTSYLYRSPSNLRIRISGDKVTITHKSGELGDAARKEINLTVPKSHLMAFVEFLEAIGYKECTCIKTKRYTYVLGNMNVELSINDCLGYILEVETLTSDEAMIDELTSEVDKVMLLLGLRELPAEQYKKMFEEMYARSMKPVSQHKFV